MSYKTTSNIHPFIHVYRNVAIVNSTNYGRTSGEAGFPYDTIDNSGGGLTFNMSTRGITITVKGLYLISYSFNVRNNNDTISGDNIFFGVSVTRGTTVKPYFQQADPESFNSSLRFNISNAIFVSCDNGDIIKGYVADIQSTGHEVITLNPGATSLSVALIAPYS